MNYLCNFLLTHQTLPLNTVIIASFNGLKIEVERYNCYIIEVERYLLYIRGGTILVI